MASNPTSRSAGDIDLQESVAGEEDPGASIDMASAGRGDQPAGTRGGASPPTAGAPMRPGDEAPMGTAGTGEDVCPVCGGSGTTAGRECPHCLGTGKVNVGIGGA